MKKGASAPASPAKTTHPSLMPENNSNAPQGDDGIHQPRRLQHRRTTGARLPQGAVVVTRASRWGNPFRAEVYGRDEAIERYRQWITTGSDRFPAGLTDRLLDPIRCRRELGTLRGRDLACSCPLGLPCHADVLLELANAPLEVA